MLQGVVHGFPPGCPLAAPTARVVEPSLELREQRDRSLPPHSEAPLIGEAFDLLLDAKECPIEGEGPCRRHRLFRRSAASTKRQHNCTLQATSVIFPGPTGEMTRSVTMCYYSHARFFELRPVPIQFEEIAQMTTVATDADLIRDYLAALGMSQREAARELGIDERAVRYFCAGKEQVPLVVFLALGRLLQIQGHDRALALLADGTMSASDGMETVERLQKANKVLRAANAVALKSLRAGQQQEPGPLIGERLESLDALMHSPFQRPEQVAKIKRTLDHFRARFVGMLDRGLSVEDIGERYGLSPDWVQKFLESSTG